jgi:hypothetical protein
MMNREHWTSLSKSNSGASVSGCRQQGDAAAEYPKFHPGDIDSELNPGINISMTETFTAFEGPRRLASGPLTDIAPTIKRAEARAAEPIVIFSDATGRAIDLDLRGSVDDMLRWLAGTNDKTNEQPAASEPRGRGRPKLGVVAREVTLLPRHWEWLNAQPGGASVALRKLVEAARRSNGDADRLRAARDAAYHFMSAMAGNLANFEEASRALFADDRRRFTSLIAAWPPDIRDHVVKLVERI